MRVLVTGACGNIGSTLLPRLIEKGYEVRALDLPTEENEATAKKCGRAEFIWGDITDSRMVKKAVDNDIDAVVHLAFMLPPSSEEKPGLAEKVNTQGTSNVVEAINASGKKSKLIFSSTVSVFGITEKENPPIRPDHSVNGTDNYTRHKILCEEMIRRSAIRYTILRLAITLPAELGAGSFGFGALYSLPLEGRVEFLHGQDACTAIINCITEKKSDNRTFIIAGGKGNQVTFKDLIMLIFGAMNLPDPDWSMFAKQPNYADWYDTSESQAILRYQKRTLRDYVADIKRQLTQ